MLYYMKLLIRILVCLTACIVLPGNIYYWVDDSGTKNYTNTNPPSDTPVKIIEERKRIPEKLSPDGSLGYEFKVIKVFDGDSILVSDMNLTLSVRLVGIDAPELGYKAKKGQPFSRQSKNYLEKRINNRKIRLKLYGTDQYNRQLAEVFVDGQNINLEIIKKGLAEVYRGRKPEKLNNKIYLKSEAIAKKAKKGIWQLGKTYKSPKQWRKDNPGK